MLETIDRFIDYLVTQKGRSHNTCQSYRHDLKMCVAFFEANGIGSWQKVDQYAVINLIAKLKQEHRASTTINRTISSLRQLFRYLLRRHEIQVNPMDYVDHEHVAPKKPPITLSQKEIEQLFMIPDTTTTNGLRDRTLLELMYGTGMLVSELINLKRSQVHLDLQILQLQDNPHHQRIVPLGKMAGEWLKKYLETTADTSSEYVFLNARGHQMTRQGVWKNFKRIVKESGLKKDITLQTLRHTFIADLLNNGASWQVVQTLLGRESGRENYESYVHFDSQELVTIYHQCHPRA
ncbi:tyrosine-type recombinase/integrase [Limosilactobacillus sp. Sa3CUN2]|uniref:Tyrosine-type recombinase/integrase n=1 Tax=Limosilactobacillus avistercoris TaxID=2762243 RepID=A0ABR8PBD9_9LACO|nr:tyrosine-type recombinase/integrase [Limosilactobacillus avistercoris]MBD7894620.1 tyrosine-type recombinase/integrase [Limosilactobacillus avistercoris]